MTKLLPICCRSWFYASANFDQVERITGFCRSKRYFRSMTFFRSYRRLELSLLLALIFCVFNGVTASSALALSTPDVYSENTYWQDPSLPGNPLFIDVKAKHVTKVTISFYKHKFRSLKTKKDNSYLGLPGLGYQNWVAKTTQPGLFKWLNSSKANYTVRGCNKTKCVNFRFR